MTYNVTYRLHCVVPCFRRVLKQNQWLYPLKKSIPSRKFSSDFPSRYNEDKYGELKNRLEAVPYLSLLEKEADRFHQDLCYENDERLEEALKWCSKVFNYNIKNCKMVHSTALLKAFCTYGFNIDDANWRHWDSDSWRLAIILAWCFELYRLYFIIEDDMMDQSVLRRGEPCWYKRPDVGMCAVNDILLIQSGIYKLLQKHFAGSKYYMNVLHEFLKASHETAYGQCLDVRFSSINQNPKFDKFTFQWFQTLTEYKTTPITYCLPVHLAMHLAGGYSVKEFDITRKICLKLGLYFQVQDDCSDCFGSVDIKFTGKYGNDIREGRCTWLAVKFLEEASEHMKKEFFGNYGVDDKDATAKVLELYRKVNLLRKFEEFDEQLCVEINALVESMTDIKGYLFYNLLAELRRRKTDLIGSL